MDAGSTPGATSRKSSRTSASVRLSGLSVRKSTRELWVKERGCISGPVGGVGDGLTSTPTLLLGEFIMVMMMMLQMTPPTQENLNQSIQASTSQSDSVEKQKITDQR
jgi:hypothetical protein